MAAAAAKKTPVPMRAPSEVRVECCYPLGDALPTQPSTTIGRQPWNQYEGALMGIRMRDDKLWVVGGKTFNIDDVHIQRARAPVAHAHPIGGLFQLLSAA